MLDKTGTLTLGVPKVVAVEPGNGATEDAVLQTAAIAEQHSEHPLGEAIVRAARERRLPFRAYSSLRYLPGKGLVCVDADGEILVGAPALLQEHGIALPASSAADGSVVLVARNRQLLGSITLADQVRAEAKETVRALNQRGQRTVLLTGDSPETAKAIGNELGVQEAVGGLLPQQSSTGSANSPAKAARLRWSATASTMRPRWPRPRSASRWARERMWRWKPPT